mmetsp:Transcript_40059/g.114691  ORF Transcript_40059/g.114691 Transcript_40059/m.114691 type:complete len:94 (+) Transcript_40059:254-535(+)
MMKRPTRTRLTLTAKIPKATEVVPRCMVWPKVRRGSLQNWRRTWMRTRKEKKKKKANQWNLRRGRDLNTWLHFLRCTYQEDILRVFTRQARCT